MLKSTELSGFGAAADGGFTDLGGCYFDGGDYYLLAADWSGLGDSKLGTISFWYRQASSSDGSSTLRYFIQNLNGMFFIIIGTSGNDNVRLGLYGLSPNRYVWDTQTATDSFDSASGWVHYVASWDLGNTVGHVYVNGVADKSTETVAPINQIIDYTRGKWGFGASSSPGNIITADVAQFYFNPGEYVDLSDAANLAKFYNEGPVDLGSDGSLPTGTSPVFFANRTASGAVGEFDTNAGTGGDMPRTGTLTESSNIPFPGLVA